MATVTATKQKKTWPLNSTSFLIRPAQFKDLDKIVCLERSIFSQPWSKGSFRKELANKVSSVYVASHDNRTIGYAVVWLIHDEVQINKIAILPSHRRMGLATRMLELILQRARRNGATEAFIEVRASNTAAIGLYKKQGFVTCGIRPLYYDSPKEDALLMKTRI